MGKRIGFNARIDHRRHSPIRAQHHQVLTTPTPIPSNLDICRHDHGEQSCSDAQIDHDVKVAACRFAGKVVDCNDERYALRNEKHWSADSMRQDAVGDEEGETPDYAPSCHSA